MVKITPVDILEIGRWYEKYKEGEFRRFEGKVMVVDSLDDLNGYDARVKILKGQILYPEAVEEIFGMWNGGLMKKINHNYDT
tara:strand:+ start:2074 stop:2319 length:246 start_codon:yes stop_codon:yes gene_type:complete